MPGTRSEDWLESFSVNAYRPMVRLASCSDHPFLSGHRARIKARRYRRTQRSLLREYLKGLSGDFQRLHSIAAAQKASSELSEGLLSFHFGVLWIEARLLLQALIPHAIDMEPLLASVQSLALATRDIARPTLRLHVT
jgi:hypothetical protein